MRKLRNAGFTIVEVLVAVTITSLLVMVIMNFMADGLVNFMVIQARRDLLAETQDALDKIADETRLSANADENNRWEDDNAPGAPGNKLSWESDGDTLILATAVLNQDNEIVFSDSSQYITEKNNNIYFVEKGTLYRRTIASPVEDNSSETTCPTGSESCPADEALIATISHFLVRYIDGDGNEVPPTDARSIELEIEVSRPYYGRTITADYKTRMVFRND